MILTIYCPGERAAGINSVQFTMDLYDEDFTDDHYRFNIKKAAVELGEAIMDRPCEAYFEGECEICGGLKSHATTCPEQAESY